METLLTNPKIIGLYFKYSKEYLDEKIDMGNTKDELLFQTLQKIFVLLIHPIYNGLDNNLKDALLSKKVIYYREVVANDVDSGRVVSNPAHYLKIIVEDIWSMLNNDLGVSIQMSRYKFVN